MHVLNAELTSFRVNLPFTIEFKLYKILHHICIMAGRFE